MVKKVGIVASIASTQAAIISKYNDVPNPMEKIVYKGLVLAPAAHDFWFARECVQNPLFDIGPVADITASHPNVIGEEDGLVVNVRGVNGSTRMALNIENNEVVGHCLIRPKNGAPIEFIRRSAPFNPNNRPMISFKMNDEAYPTDVVMGFTSFKEALSSLAVTEQWEGIRNTPELKRYPLDSPVVISVSHSANRIPSDSAEETDRSDYIAFVDIETPQGWEEIILFKVNDTSGDNDRGVARFAVHIPARNERVINRSLEFGDNFLYRALVAFVRDNSKIDWKNRTLKLTKCNKDARYLSSFTRALQDTIPLVFTAATTEEMLKIRAQREGHKEPIKREDVRAFMQSINEQFHEVPFDETPHDVWSFRRVECPTSIFEGKKAPRGHIDFRTKAAARATLEALKSLPQPTAPVHVNLETSFPNRLITFPPVNFSEKDASVEKRYLDNVNKARDACQDVGLYQGMDEAHFKPIIVAPNTPLDGSTVAGKDTQSVSQMKYSARLPGGIQFALQEVVSIVESASESSTAPSPARLSVTCQQSKDGKVIETTEGHYDFLLDFHTDPATKPRPPAGIAYVDQVTVLPYGEFERMQRVDLDDMEHLRLLSDMPMLHFHPIGGPLRTAFDQVTSGLCGAHVKNFDSTMLDNHHFSLARKFAFESKTEGGKPATSVAFELLFDEGIVRAVVNQERLVPDEPFEDAEKLEDIQIVCESYDIDKDMSKRISRVSFPLATVPAEVRAKFDKTREQFSGPFRFDLYHSTSERQFRLLTLNELGTAPASLLVVNKKQISTLKDFDALYPELIKATSLDSPVVNVRSAALKAIPFLYSDSLHAVDPYDGKPDPAGEDTEEVPTPIPTEEDTEEKPKDEDVVNPSKYPMKAFVGGCAGALALVVLAYVLCAKRKVDKRTPLLDAAASSMVEAGDGA